MTRDGLQDRRTGYSIVALQHGAQRFPDVHCGPCDAPLCREYDVCWPGIHDSVLIAFALLRDGHPMLKKAIRLPSVSSGNTRR